MHDAVSRFLFFSETELHPSSIPNFLGGAGSVHDHDWIYDLSVGVVVPEFGCGEGGGRLMLQLVCEVVRV